MFICNECQKKYESKPTYCDCGNDAFEEIIQESVLNKKTAAAKTDFLKKYDISVFALSFFVICILLSLLVLLFFANPSKNSKSQPKETTVEHTSKTNIPDIETFWRDKTPVTSQKVTKKTISVTQKIQPESKIIQTSLTQKQKTSKSSNSKSQPTSTDSKAKKQKIKTVTEAKKTNSQNPVSSFELNNYKLSLRQALFTNLSVSAIQGAGKCGIEFSIDKNGKLINRGFTFQSGNKSVNDEVYKMLMKMPKYYAPPESYKGEKIKMTFEFDNGNYLINYTN